MTDFMNCPHCGAELAADAKFCRHCGSSDTDGWRDEPDCEIDDGFDYDDYIEQEVPSTAANLRIRPLWRLVAVILLLLFVLAYVL